MQLKLDLRLHTYLSVGNPLCHPSLLCHFYGYIPSWVQLTKPQTCRNAWRIEGRQFVPWCRRPLLGINDVLLFFYKTLPILPPLWWLTRAWNSLGLIEPGSPGLMALHPLRRMQWNTSFSGVELSGLHGNGVTPRSEEKRLETGGTRTHDCRSGGSRLNHVATSAIINPLPLQCISPGACTCMCMSHPKFEHQNNITFTL